MSKRSSNQPDDGRTRALVERIAQHPDALEVLERLAYLPNDCAAEIRIHTTGHRLDELAEIGRRDGWPKGFAGGWVGVQRGDGSYWLHLPTATEAA